MDNIEIFAKRLKELRKEKNMKRDEFCKIFNVSYSAITKYENAMTYPSIQNLIKIAEYFDVSIDYLLGLTDIKNINRLQKVAKRADKVLNDLALILIKTHEEDKKFMTELDEIIEKNTENKK